MTDANENGGNVEPSHHHSHAGLIAFIFRLMAAVTGFWLVATLTQGLFAGQIQYSVGELDEVTHTTSGFLETLFAYLTFCPIGAALLIAGLAPDAYLKYKWLWRALLGTTFSAYVLSGIFWG